MHLFYEPEFLTNGNILSPDESKHCVRVLRHKQGDTISVMNGKGAICNAEIVEANPKKCVLHIRETSLSKPRPFTIHMAVAPTKNTDRFEWFLEKATEIGIDEITPILCEHSERKIIKTERLEKVIVAAAKQSLKAFMPKLNEAKSFKEFIALANKPTSCFIAHCEETPKELLKKAYKLNSDTLILIGPEGDFSGEEIKMAQENGCFAISLGKERLRTETAALMACATINLINQQD